MPMKKAVTTPHRSQAGTVCVFVPDDVPPRGILYGATQRVPLTGPLFAYRLRSDGTAVDTWMVSDHGALLSSGWMDPRGYREAIAYDMVHHLGWARTVIVLP
ncbi:hypothetical protein [Nocardiopsis suaedae]|uniref:Uncharacterized protein n=1 Tax=Nocardiopsis suaedae TaxID=3018444 RepID=A0ABT4TTG9_9ACTN|nr:hypothetical protein [Nocardiopsis suaedae]MDA2807983.1 hypothetical protein [Nocardiopsis suaedae]